MTVLQQLMVPTSEFQNGADFGTASNTRSLGYGMKSVFALQQGILFGSMVHMSVECGMTSQFLETLF
jgi:hypothetical protein